MSKNDKQKVSEPKKHTEASMATFEEFFQDYYKHRWQIYFMNLVRGIWFGFGSVIGGTVVIALLLWLLTIFQQVPFLTDFFQMIQRSIEQSRQT